MRPFEWLVVLSFIPAILLSFISPSRRCRWLLVAAPLPALAIVMHLAAEGWRTQMVPLYVLAALVLASRLPALLGRAGTVRRGRDLLASCVIALMLVFGAVFAGWLLPVVTLPEPTGPYQVGIVDRELVDAVRGRRLMVSVWYPAAQRGTPAPLTHHPDQVMTAETWAEHDPLLAGKLDLARIGSFGHSFGGATALEVCRVDARCRAAVNMDGGLCGGIVAQPAVRPLLLMSSADSSRYPDTVGEWTHMITHASNAAYWLELPNSTHLSFTFSQLLSPLLVPQGFEPRAGLRVVDKYLRAFFDLHLRGVDTRAFGPDSGETDVRWHIK